MKLFTVNEFYEVKVNVPYEVRKFKICVEYTADVESKLHVNCT
jgi:hypothetical protein